MAGNSSSLLSTVSMPEFTDLVRHEWVTSPDYLDNNAMALFVSDPVGMAQGATRRFDEYDGETYADVKPEGAPASKSQVGVGYNTTMTYKTIAKSIDVTFEDRVQNRYRDVDAKLRSLVNFCSSRIDLDLTHRLTFATSSSYTDKNGNTVDTTVGDGNVLAYTAHTLAHSSTTYSNRLSGDPAFSQTSLQAALLLAATNIYTNFGERRQMDFNTIFCFSDPQTEQEIDQLIRSTADVDAVQSGIVNVYQNKFTRVSLPRLATTATGAYDSTKRRWWGIAATNQGLMGWQAIFSEVVAPFLKTPAPGNNGEDIDTWNWTYSTGAMYGITVVSGRGLIMSCPTS